MIRDDLRANEEFWELSETVLEIVDIKMDWISAILRSESKKALRMYAGKMEEIRQARLESAAAEKKAEQEQLQAMPNFGMF